MKMIDQAINNLPKDVPDWQRSVRIEHIYTRVMLLWCEANGVRTLGDVLAKREGHIFCSNIELGPCPNLGVDDRVSCDVVLNANYSERVRLRFSSRHVSGDTPRERLREGGYTFSVVAELSELKDGLITFEPILMGSPWLDGDENGPYQSVMWYAEEFYEHFLEDFDEFSKVAEFPEPAGPDEMEFIRESAFKSCLGELLGDSMPKDWGGESSDFYTSHLHLRGRRVTGAFLLKGPAKFEPMNLKHLGKNNDQIVRLADEPADILFVQHSHDILPVVRKTLRAFAVQPSRPRRYCLIDGRDSLWTCPLF
jgi:hypothetical protein